MGTKGRFLVLEGPDGAGKSRAAAELAQHLRDRGRPVTLTREPGGTRLGEQIRALLLDTGTVDRSPEADALLFNAARAQLVTEVIRPALERGEIVLSDRFAPSTLAYQGHGSGVDLAALRRLEAVAIGETRPDLILLLDVPPSVGLARRAGGDPAQVTRFEDEARHDQAFHARVRAGFLALAAAEPALWRVLDGSRAPELVDRDVATAVDEFLGHGEPLGVLARMQQ